MLPAWATVGQLHQRMREWTLYLDGSTIRDIYLARRAIERVAIGLQGFQCRSSVCSWLHRIAVNGCLNALRDRSRRPGRGRKEPPLSSGRPRCLNE